MSGAHIVEFERAILLADASMQIRIERHYRRAPRQHQIDTGAAFAEGDIGREILQTRYSLQRECCQQIHLFPVQLQAALVDAADLLWRVIDDQLLDGTDIIIVNGAAGRYRRRELESQQQQYQRQTEQQRDKQFSESN